MNNLPSLNAYVVWARQINQFIYRNREQLAASDSCGCIYCLHISDARSVTEYWDKQQTACCPVCGLDKVVASASGLPINNAAMALLRHFVWDGLLDDDGFEFGRLLQHGYEGPPPIPEIVTLYVD